MNEKDKMLLGELYDANYNEELIKERLYIKDMDSPTAKRNLPSGRLPTRWESAEDT